MSYLRFGLRNGFFFVLIGLPGGYMIETYSTHSRLRVAFTDAEEMARVRWMEATGEVLEADLLGKESA